MTKTVAIYSPAGTPGLKRLRMFAEEQGWHVAAEMRDDPATSSRAGPGYTHLCKLVARGAVQIVLAESLVSMGSRVDDLLTMADALRVSNGTLHLLDDGIDTCTASGAAWLDTLVSLASYRTHKRRAAAKAGQARAIRAGVKWGRPRIPDATLLRLREALLRGDGVRHTARAFGVSPAKVALEKKAMAQATAVSQG